MNVEAVASDEINFKKLDLRRIDVVICGDIKGLEIINKLKLKGLKILDPPLEMFYTYCLLDIYSSPYIFTGACYIVV